MKNDQAYLSVEEAEVELDQSLAQLENRDASAEQGSDELVEEEPALAEARYLEVAAAASAMLEGQEVRLDTLTALTDEERIALENLQQVVRGRDEGDEFLYAEERLEGLNQVLARLQPLLAVGCVHHVLHASLHQLVDGFEELRAHLTGLGDAEEEVVHVAAEKKPDTDEDDDDGDGDDEADEAEDDADVERPPATSTVWDPDDRGDGPA